MPLGNTTVVLTGTGAGFEGWSVDGITGPIDGIANLDPGVDRSALPARTHPNGITSIDHLVVGTGDIDRTAAALRDAGLQCRRERSTTAYGSPMRQQFYWLGDVILELVGPDEGEPTGTGEPTGDDRFCGVCVAPCATHTPQNAWLFGLALVSQDLDATVATLGDLAGTPRDAVQPGRRIAGIRGGRVGVSIPLAVMSPHPGRR
ncbi:MAG: hypothetical protein M5U19_10675 [Microthrixaceae bacterium]|nr:hypothetical protein [Microthrixaceae bacterium]